MAVSQSKYKYINSVFENTQTNIITITEDKLENKLISYTAKVRKCNDWLGALGVFVSISLAMFTSNFKDVLGIKGEAWFHFFLFMGLISFFYLIFCVYNLISNRTNVKDLINDIKNN